jgi:positive regulator of sigma E activity
MAATYKFLIRLIVAVLMALLIGRVFFHGMTAVRVIAFAAILLALAYLFEYAKRHDK